MNRIRAILSIEEHPAAHTSVDAVVDIRFRQVRRRAGLDHLPRILLGLRKAGNEQGLELPDPNGRRTKIPELGDTWRHHEPP
jgi:hypothetical protein